MAKDPKKGGSETVGRRNVRTGSFVVSNRQGRIVESYTRGSDPLPPKAAEKSSDRNSARGESLPAVAKSVSRASLAVAKEAKRTEVVHLPARKGGRQTVSDDVLDEHLRELLHRRREAYEALADK